jgi:tRNA threonylcarbamoyladenosine biosynthesis protein TsaB
MALGMLILAVDTSNSAGSLALLRDGVLQGVHPMHSEEGFSTVLFRDLAKFCFQFGFALAEIDLFAVNAGPGSFTGLRVGLTAVKAWSEAYQKPIAAVSGLEAVATQLPNSEGWLVPILDARRSQIYAGIYHRTRDGLKRRGEECIMAPAEFFSELVTMPLSSPPIFVTPHPLIFRDALSQSPFANCALGVVSPILAPWIGQRALVQFSEGNCVDALRLEARYIRRCDAEVNGPRA